MEKQIRKYMDQLISGICIGLFVLLVIIGTYQILVRYIFNRPSTMSEELLTYGFTWMSLFAAALVFGQREHMRIGFLADKMPDTVRRWLEIISEILIFLFARIVMVYGGWEIVQLTRTQKTASLGISMGTVYLAVLVSGICILIYSILNICALFRAKKEESR